MGSNLQEWELGLNNLENFHNRKYGGGSGTQLRKELEKGACQAEMYHLYFKAIYLTLGKLNKFSFKPIYNFVLFVNNIITLRSSAI